MRRWLGLMLVLGIIGYTATGLAVIQQDELGVVRRFGAVRAEPWQPGLHWGLPWGLDRLDRVKIGQTRTLTVGAPAPDAAPLSRTADPSTDDRLTGDLNLVSAQATLQYRVSDPVAFLFASGSVETALSATVEAALTRVLASRGVDDALTTGRAEIADRMASTIQEQADRQNLGISVRAVRLGRVAPPTPVAPAFADAARAQRSPPTRDPRRSIATVPAPTPGARAARSPTARPPPTIDPSSSPEAKPTALPRSWSRRARPPTPPVSGSIWRPSPNCSPASAAR